MTDISVRVICSYDRDISTDSLIINKSMSQWWYTYVHDGRVNVKFHV